MHEFFIGHHTWRGGMVNPPPDKQELPVLTKQFRQTELLKITENTKNARNVIN
jgi:hypothetical protein